MNNKKKLAIIDADCFLFFAGWHYKEQLNKMGELGAKARVDKMISNILSKIDADYYLGFYGKHKSKNFRYKFATLRPYKGTRDSPPWQEFFKPIIKDHYKNKWGFIGMSDLEADDAVVIAFHQFKDEYDIVMVGEDKDMDQIGEFTKFNPSTKEYKFISKENSLKSFYKQMLTGDNSDNIEGIKGVGEKSKYVIDLMNMENPSDEELFDYVLSIYKEKFKEHYLYYLVENYILLKMISKPSFDYPKEIKPILWKEKPTSIKIKLIDL
jgi:5'-3' exonuclease